MKQWQWGKRLWSQGDFRRFKQSHYFFPFVYKCIFCCSTTSRNMALLMILSALRFEALSVMELPRKRLNRLDIIKYLFTLCLFINTLGYQVVQVYLIKWFHFTRCDTGIKGALFQSNCYNCSFITLFKLLLAILAKSLILVKGEASSTPRCKLAAQHIVVQRMTSSRAPHLQIVFFTLGIQVATIIFIDIGVMLPCSWPMCN